MTHAPRARRSRLSQGMTALAALCLACVAAHAVVLPVSTRGGIGAIPYQVGTAKGVTFRTWAPNAQAVSVALASTFFSTTAHQLSSEGNGYWSGDIANVVPGAQYKFAIKYNNVYRLKNDPRARDLTSSVGNSVVYDPNAFQWQTQNFQMANWNDLVIYEMHVGTYGTSASGNPPATFLNCIDKLDHLKELGINCISLMPINEFPGDLSWGYNPSYLFSVESAYGTPDDLKRFVDAAHARGIAVLNDVLYNHIGPNDMDMWQYDGWSLNNGGGIFFYNDSRANTPWGNTRPDYTRGEVRQFIRDNVMLWLTEFRMDGLRWDATKYIRRTDQFGQELPEAWSLLQWCNDEIDAQFPGKISVAEDFDDSDWISKTTGAGGAGFDSQWDWYVHNVRDVIQQTWDSGRDMWKLKESITHSYNGNHTERVIYVESHDEVANGKKRMSSSISPNTPGDYWARKRSTLGGATTLFSPGIPFMFQGQEFLEDGWFQDSDPLDWGKKTTFAGIFAMYKDMIALRTNKLGVTRGLTGPNTNVHHVNNSNKLIGWHRWMNGGAGDDVVILANFSATPWTNYRIGMPRGGMWKCRFNSDWNGYSSDFANTASLDVDANGYAYDGLPQSATLNIGPYSVLVYSQGDAQVPGNPADLDGSCVVDSGDVSFVLLDFGSAGGPSDLDGDGVVGSGDVAMILLEFGWTCN